jgi:LAO/AO transport system kinase
MEFIRKIRAGDVRSASQMIGMIEDGLPEARAVIKCLFPFTGRARIIGITGSPGVGKSTIVDGLIESIRKRGKSVGVLAVDPTSPFSGGAILGDRIRMQRHVGDPEVFIRSLATRGSLGGLAKAVGDAIHVLDAMGKEIILVETVGTGQQEVDIANHAHTVILVLVPGMGDEIQTIKAGIMEIADIFVINKADREGTRKLKMDITAMLEVSRACNGGWYPSITQIESISDPAVFEIGVEEVFFKIEDHYKQLLSTNFINERLRRKNMYELNAAISACIFEPLLEHLISSGKFASMMEVLMRRETDPYTLAEEIAKNYFKTCNFSIESDT